MDPPVRFLSADGLLLLHELQGQRLQQRWQPPHLEDIPPGKMMIVRRGGMGDIVLLRPAIQTFRNRRPDVETILVTDWPTLGNAHLNIDELILCGDENILLLQEYVEWHEGRYKIHRSDIFAYGFGLGGCDSYDITLPWDGPRLIEEDYLVVQLSGSSKYRCPSVGYMWRLAEAVSKRYNIAIATLGNSRIDLGDFNYTGLLAEATVLSLLRYARIVIAGDSGPFHVARALGTPCVGFYGPIPPELRVAGLPDCYRIIHAKCLYGSPCQEDGNCNKIDVAKCLEGVPLEHALAVVEELMETCPRR